MKTLLLSLCIALLASPVFAQPASFTKGPAKQIDAIDKLHHTPASSVKKLRWRVVPLTWLTALDTLRATSPWAKPLLESALSMR